MHTWGFFGNIEDDELSAIAVAVVDVLRTTERRNRKEFCISIIIVLKKVRGSEQQQQHQRYPITMNTEKTDVVVCSSLSSDKCHFLKFERR